LKIFSFFKDLFKFDADSGIFRQIPLPVNRKLFASPMPFGAYDPGNRLLGIYKKNNINHVLMLVTTREVQKKAKKDLIRIYLSNNISYTQFEFIDLQAPDIKHLHALVLETHSLLQSKNVAVHCHAGVGRTGVAICAIVQHIKKCSSDEAYNYVREHMLINMTDEQKRFVAKLRDTPLHN